jgi:hypothetical protein
MLVDDGTTKDQARFCEEIAEKWREKVCAICYFRSRSALNEVFIQILLALSIYMMD